jgi:hypothetical protein
MKPPMIAGGVAAGLYQEPVDSANVSDNTRRHGAAGRRWRSSRRRYRVVREGHPDALVGIDHGRSPGRAVVGRVPAGAGPAAAGESSRAASS